MTETKETPAGPKTPEKTTPTTEETAAATTPVTETAEPSSTGATTTTNGTDHINGDSAETASGGEENATDGDGTTGETTNGDGKDEEKPEPPKEMRAIVLTGFGGLKGVKVLKKPEPTLQAGEVLIRVKACGLNFQDLIIRLGAIASPPKTPCILGFECAGEIEAVGEGVTDFQIGDRVVALPEFKAWAELVAVSEKFVYKIPDTMSFSDAAAITLSYLVAHVLVFDLASIKPGNSVLLHSAGGGVGQAVAQLCKTIDNVTVFGVASKSKHETLQANNLIDHLIERGTDYLNEVRKVSSEGLDIVLDCLCGEECNRGYSLLKPMGKYVLYGSANVVTGETKSFFSVARSWWQVDKVSPIKLFDENKSLMGFNLRQLLYQQEGAEYVRKTIASVFDLWLAGKIKPTIDSSWALEDVTEAMQKMHDRKNIGKIVLDPAQTPKPKPATPAKGKAKDKKQASTEEKDKKSDANADGDDKKDDDTNGTVDETAGSNKETNGENGEAEKSDDTTAPAVAAPTNGETTNGTTKENEEKESS